MKNDVIVFLTLDIPNIKNNKVIIAWKYSYLPSRPYYDVIGKSDASMFYLQLEKFGQICYYLFYYYRVFHQQSLINSQSSTY